MAATDKLFDSWHAFKKKRINGYELLRCSAPIRKQIGELLEQGSYTNPTLRAVRFCKNLLTNFEALWTFLDMDEVEPTNNHAERCLRHAVIWRKKYFATRSDYGSEFVARIESVNLTCKLQSKNAFQFLAETLQCFFSKTTTPSLLASA